MALSILPSRKLELLQHAASPLLAPYVESYWSCRVLEPPATVQLVPDALVDLTFDLVQKRAFVSGPIEAGESYEHTRPAELLGASIKPGAVMPILGVSPKSLKREWQPLTEVIGEVAESLTALIVSAPSRAEQLVRLDAFLLARVFATVSEPRVREAVAAIEASEGGVDVEALGKLAGASPRNLGRLFDDWVGMPPKRFARIVRLQAALRRLQENPEESLSALALDCGFADQAHLTRELRAMSGLAPGELQRKLSDSFKS